MTLPACVETWRGRRRQLARRQGWAFQEGGRTMDTAAGNPLLPARRRTDALPDDDRAFLKGLGMALLGSTCCWLLLLALL